MQKMIIFVKIILKIISNDNGFRRSAREIHHTRR